MRLVVMSDAHNEVYSVHKLARAGDAIKQAQFNEQACSQKETICRLVYACTSQLHVTLVAMLQSVRCYGPLARLSPQCPAVWAAH